MTAMKKRMQHIDIAKGIAIICIILGHLNNWQINRIVFTFHVPIFFLISGSFINRKLTVKEYIKNKARRLLIPYVCTCVAMIVFAALEYGLFFGMEATGKAALEWIYAAVYGAGDSYTSPFYIKAIGAIWFLWALFWGSIFLRCLLNCGMKQRLLSIIILFFFGYVSRILFWFPFSIQAGCCATLFMYFGWLAKKLGEEIKSVSVEIKMAATVLALIIWLCFIKDFQSFWLVHCDFGRGITDIVGCMCGSYIIVLLSKFIQEHFVGISRVLMFAGRHSLIILCLHNIELNTLPWWKLTGALVNHGMPVGLQVFAIIAGKMLLIFTAAAICLRCSWIRKLFGYESLPAKSNSCLPGSGTE